MAIVLINEIPTEVGSGADEILRLREELASAESLRAEQQKFYVSAVADAKRYRWLREYLPSDDESWDDALVAAGTAEEIDAVIDDAVKENGK